MCGIAAAVGGADPRAAAAAMVAHLRHRGPDAQDLWHDDAARVALGHDRLAIRDLSDAGRQPMRDPDGRYLLSFNGEIYNDLELRAELADRWTFRSTCDSEVLLAAWARWGTGCLERLIGMFAFVVWDRRERALWAARDRFGVKPLYFHRGQGGSLRAASEIAALLAAGVPAEPAPAAWAAYLAQGIHDRGRRTFWRGIERVEAGTVVSWRDGRLERRRWYDLEARVADTDERPEDDVRDAYRSLLEASVRLRFRSDVPVGINLSGGLDSSTLLALVHAVQGPDSDVSAFTFTCGDPAYDELPWVEKMLERTRHPLVVSRLDPEDVPALAEDVHRHQLEPFGGLPTLAYARLFEHARAHGTIVLLDGQGIDEQWAGYDYYRRLRLHGVRDHATIQGTSASPVKPACLVPDALELGPESVPVTAEDDALRARQLFDLVQAKLPRALRFNDGVSMRASCELREPFLDHRLVELAVCQPADRKIGASGTGKRLLRQIAQQLLPSPVSEAPKRALQTPQREWLRGPLRDWTDGLIEAALDGFGGTLLRPQRVRDAWRRFQAGEGDNSFFVWQWLSLGLTVRALPHLQNGPHVSPSASETAS